MLKEQRERERIGRGIQHGKKKKGMLHCAAAVAAADV
jgi:hypothetical protein